jgi:hypothetical protein
MRANRVQCLRELSVWRIVNWLTSSKATTNTRICNPTIASSGQSRANRILGERQSRDSDLTCLGVMLCKMAIGISAAALALSVSFPRPVGLYDGKKKAAPNISGRPPPNYMLG